MSKKPKRTRVDTEAEAEALTANPFSGLANQLPGGLPQQAENGGVGESPAETPPVSGPSFTVQRTRKGGYPIFLEKRPNGKVVTVIRNVTGALDDLLKLLKKRCGAGGHATEDAIEIQGDHRERVERFLHEQGA